MQKENVALNDQPADDTQQSLIDQIDTLPEFCTQAANVMCRLYGTENNKWALLMPGLIHHVSVTIGSRVEEIAQSGLDTQLTMMPELMNTIRQDETLLQEDPELERATRVRMDQLTDAPQPARRLNPFRDMPQDLQDTLTADDPADDPDLIV